MAKEILRLGNAKGKAIYVDDASMAAQGAFLFLPKPYFSQMEDKEKAVSDKFDEIVAQYEMKDDPFHKRFADEMIYNEKKHKESIGEQFDKMKGMKLAYEIPDEEGTIAVFSKTKPASFANATVFYKEKIKDGKPFYKNVIYSQRDGYSWECNRECESLGQKVTSEIEKDDTADLPYPILSLDYEPARSDKLSLCELTKEQTQRFRQLKTHKFVGNLPSKSVGVLINGQIAGVIGYNQVFTTFYGAFEEDELFLQFSIACTPFDRNVRMGKLIDRISLWEKCAKLMLNDYDKTKFKRIVSTSITPYPECKHARRLMELRNKTYDAKTGMYKLVYGCEMTHEKTLKQVFNEWMDELEHARKQKEKQERKNGNSK